MEIIFNSLFKIDINTEKPEQLPNTQNQADLESYIRELLDVVVEDKDNKGFEFHSEHTEVRSLIGKVAGLEISDFETFNEYALAIANRLHAREIESDAKNNLNVELVKGVAVISLVKMSNGTKKFVISKADYNEFLDAESYKRRSGMPIKKKIYKAFCATLNEKNELVQVHVYDTNSTFTVYWWREFLELSEIYTDEYNSKEVFHAIEVNILNPVKKKHKADYISLWNATVHYFRVKEEFTLDNFLTDIITDFKPFDNDLDVKHLAQKTRKLFEKGKFDSRFPINATVITGKFKKTIALTPQIDLNLKSDINNIENTIMRFDHPDGTKWVMVKSEEGYEYFKENTGLFQ